MNILNREELENILLEMKENGKYEEYHDMILDDFEEHQIVYKLEPRWDDSIWHIKIIRFLLRWKNIMIGMKWIF